MNHAPPDQIKDVERADVSVRSNVRIFRNEYLRVFLSTSTSDNMTLTRKLNVTKLHINSEVQCRFATTEINSRVENVSEAAEETEFVANLPDGAFITYFEMYVVKFWKV